MVLAKSLEPHGIIIYFKCFPYGGVMCVANGMTAPGFIYLFIYFLFFSKGVNSVRDRNLLWGVKKKID